MTSNFQRIAFRIFISNLPTDRVKVTKQDIEERFAKYGKIIDVSILKGYGFVQFAENCENAVRNAIDNENGTIFKGNKISVKQARGDAIKRTNVDIDEPLLKRSMMDSSLRCEIDDHSSNGDEVVAPKRKEVGVDRPFDAVCLVAQKQFKCYAEQVERRLTEINLVVDVVYLVRSDALSTALEDMIRRGVLYIVTIDSPLQQKNRSVTVFLLQPSPQEHRNMPLEDALVMIARNFSGYMSGLRAGSEQPSMGFLLSLLSDGKHLSVEELDRIVEHLKNRRDRLMETQGAVLHKEHREASLTRSLSPAPPPPQITQPKPSGLLNYTDALINVPPGSSINKSEDLQARILSILGKGNQTSQPTSVGNSSNNPLTALAQQLLASKREQQVENWQQQISQNQPPAANSDYKRVLDSLIQNPQMLKPNRYGDAHW